ncbi:MAG: hypothetical protein Ct9H300mP3_07310 [Gammaproteobacteria bacterium]|nr:MAG: hypothetical protein Ct9H300mP3_07310 [Gammaproteobacteria bacterium]
MSNGDSSWNFLKDFEIDKNTTMILKDLISGIIQFL